MIEVHAATLRDASWITANLRQLDREEIFCQIDDRVTTAQLAEFLILGGQGFIAYDRGEPVLLFGTTLVTVCSMSAWAMGTDAMRRAVPTVNDFLLSTHIPARLAAGVNNMEARSLVTHYEAHRWMEGLGGERHGEPYLFGKNGEMFVTYRWTVSTYRAISAAKGIVQVPQESFEHVLGK